MERPKGTNSPAASQACAVCKYQRRKCASNCPLAPFFPANNHKEFLNTCKLFGVRKITKMLENLDSQQRIIAMKCLIYQANARANDPVGGCYRIIQDLKRQIDWNKAELELVLQQLAICKAQAAATTTQQHQQPGQQQMVQVVDDDNEQDQENGIHYEVFEGFNMYDTMPVHDQHYQEEKEGTGFQGNYGGSSSVYNVFDPNYVKAESEESIAPMTYKRALLDVGEDIKPLLSVFAEKGEGAFSFDSKLSIHCSAKTWFDFSDKHVYKEEIGSIQHELKHDLKDAASLFTLTNGKG
ncbi:hypothetical protein REPUB_Repub18cG0136400 [Reevesia pubescens]